MIVPPLASQYMNLAKNSSLAIAIGYMDLVATIGGISLMQTGKEMETMIIVLLTYLALSLSISACHELVQPTHQAGGTVRGRGHV